MYSCCKAVHPFWPTTCFCRGEVKSREAAETKQKAKELCEFKRKAKQLAESERKAAVSNKKTKAAVTPNRYKFKSVKRPLEEEKQKSEPKVAVPKKGKVANDKEVGQIVTRSKVENPIPLPPALNPYDPKTDPFDYFCAKYSLTTDSQGLCKKDTKEKVETNESAKYKFSTKNERASAKIDTKAKVETNEAGARFDFRLVKKKFDLPSQTGAKTTTENLELKVKDLEAKVKVINQKKKEKAEKEKREANHSKLKEKYKQLQETFKRLKKEESEVKLQRNIQNLAEKCKNLEEKLHDEKLQIDVDVGGVDGDNEKKTKRRNKKEVNQKSRNKG